MPVVVFSDGWYDPPAVALNVPALFPTLPGRADVAIVVVFSIVPMNGSAAGRFDRLAGTANPDPTGNTAVPPYSMLASMYGGVLEVHDVNCPVKVKLFSVTPSVLAGTVYVVLHGTDCPPASVVVFAQ